MEYSTAYAPATASSKRKRTPQTISYTYDTQNRLATATTPNSSQSFTYYDNGWLKSVNDGTYTIEYQYDALGRRELVEVKQGATTLHSIDYVYDPGSKELTAIVSDRAGTFSFTTDAFGRRQTLSYPNGILGSYSYDNANRMDWLTGIDYTDGANNLLAIGYPEHDKVGNRKQRAEDATATAYSYDDLYRVTKAQTGPSAENFTYDNVGNRESGPTVKDTADASYDHNAANQMIKGRKFSYQYDSRGNQTYRIMNAAATKYWQYHWNVSNQLTQADLVNDGQTIRTVLFQYDAFGRRTIKQTTQSGSTISTNYIYDGEDIILQITSDGTNTTATHYVHGPGIDEPLAQTQSTQTYYYHADGLGSIVAITDSNKTIVQKYGYDTYGMLTSIQNPEFNNSYAFTGREWDKELGLYYYRARYYDPMEGRFISKDPIGFAGGDVNVYAYVQNNPVNWVDPSGLVPKDKLYGFPKKFWHWYHDNVKKDGDRDVPNYDDAKKHYDEWKGKGKPRGDNKGKHRPDRYRGKRGPSRLGWVIVIWPDEYCGANPNDPDCREWCELFPFSSWCECPSGI